MIYEDRVTLLVQKLEGGVSVLGAWREGWEASQHAREHYPGARSLYVQEWEGPTMTYEWKGV
jgi:hypothetical protein